MIDYNKLTTEEKQKYIKALETIKDLSCPPEGWRVPEKTSCFRCVDCKIAALQNSVDNNLE